MTVSISFSVFEMNRDIKTLIVCVSITDVGAASATGVKCWLIGLGVVA